MFGEKTNIVEVINDPVYQPEDHEIGGFDWNFTIKDQPHQILERGYSSKECGIPFAEPSRLVGGSRRKSNHASRIR